MTREVSIKGVKFVIETEVLEPGKWRARVVDCPGSEVVEGMNDQSASLLCEVRLESFIDSRRRSAHQLRVDKMMRLIGGLKGERRDGQRVPCTLIREMSEEGRLLRAKLIYEECMETIAALGVGIDLRGALARGYCSPANSGKVLDATLIEAMVREVESGSLGIEGPMDLVGVVDGCYDVMVVTTGTLSSLGIPDEPGQELVDNNNLAKFGPGGSVRSDGKLVKPPNHTPPDIAGWLESLEHGS